MVESWGFLPKRVGGIPQAPWLSAASPIALLLSSFYITRALSRAGTIASLGTLGGTKV
jgi:hypothetical protein